jgi:hypothetical protein
MRIALLAALLTWSGLASAQEEWQYSGKTADNGKFFCQASSRHGLGLRFYSEDYYVIAFLSVDAEASPPLKKIMEDKSGRVTLQPDLLYGYSTVLYYESSSDVDTGGGVQKSLSVFSVTGADYHLLEAMKDARTLNLIVDADAGRIVKLSLDDVDYAISLAGSREAIETLSNCIK